jgi:hypothetical protein
MFSTSNILPIFKEKIIPAVIVDLGRTVYFQPGHYAEAVKELDSKSQDPAKPEKYPLIWLVLDMEEKVAPRLGISSQPQVEIVIAQDTLPNYSVQQREDNIFEPTIYPIYESLINQIMLCPSLDNHELKDIQHSKFNRYYWGGSDMIGNNKANLFNDFVDAIQIKGLKLSIKNPICSKPSLKL